MNHADLEAIAKRAEAGCGLAFSHGMGCPIAQDHDNLIARVKALEGVNLAALKAMHHGNIEDVERILETEEFDPEMYD